MARGRNALQGQGGTARWPACPPAPDRTPDRTSATERHRGAQWPRCRRSRNGRLPYSAGAGATGSPAAGSAGTRLGAGAGAGATSPAALGAAGSSRGSSLAPLNSMRPMSSATTTAPMAMPTPPERLPGRR
ncbi:hypothetical protein DDE23_16830 [Pararhodobacter aggregans]|uniref:Uncharacterized protein n=1 Tax=Pararhodobacter aggregans TaxID=404875 RepID=A0A2T7UNT0_9RHOB|nr:hypothetical protein DDE23_16830 [Pararhodobacter aggregans]